MELTKVVSERTLIPISLAFSICGGIVWLSAMWYKTEATAAEVAMIKSEVNKLQFDVIDRLARIETKLDQMKVGK